MLLPAPTFDALATMEAIHAERATAIYGVPTMFIAQLGPAEFQRFESAVILREFLFDDIRLDRHTEMVGLPREVG